MRDHRKEKVSIAVPYNDATEPEFWLSLLSAQHHDLTTHGRLDHHGWFIGVRGTAVDQQRNKAVREFLQTDADWLLFIDTDQRFRFNLVDLMVESADPVERPILSALVMAVRAGKPISPAAVALRAPENPDDPPMPITYHTIPAEKHWRVGMPGTGCVLIHRSVLEAVGEQWSTSPWPWFQYAPWIRTDADGNKVPDILGEDYTFFLRAASLGFPSFVDTTIEAGHIKRHTITSRDFWPAVPPDTIEPKTFAVVPVKNQLKMTKKLLRELRDQGGYHELWVVDNGSSPDTLRWLEAQDWFELFKMPDAGIHDMWNAAVELARTRWPVYNLAFLNNDLEDLSPDFLASMAEALRGDDRCAAVGPNHSGVEAVTNVLPASSIAAAGKNPMGLAGWAFMVRSEWFDTGWRFPTECRWWFGDNLLTVDMDGAGLWYGIVTDVTCTHLGGKTGNWTDPEMAKQLAADQDAFIEILRGRGLEVTVSGS